MLNPDLSTVGKPGDLITERYQIIELLGSGGMGAVHRVADRYLNNDNIALKLLFPALVQEEQLFTRFRNEVIIARRLSHPQIVRIFDFGDAGHGYYYITMELIEGTNLAAKLRSVDRNQLSIDDALHILFDVSVALDFAHRQGVLHRDLKPDNILLAEDGSVKLSDFGAARLMKVDQSITKTGQLVGSLGYMSPESYRGEGLDARADIYSFGILAFELLAGRRPFRDESILGLMAQHLNHPVPDIHSIRTEVPDWTVDLIETCLEKNPKDRFQKVSEIAEILFVRMCERGNTPRLVSIPESLAQFVSRPTSRWFGLLAGKQMRSS